MDAHIFLEIRDFLRCFSKPPVVCLRHLFEFFMKIHQIISTRGACFGNQVSRNFKNLTTQSKGRGLELISKLLIDVQLDSEAKALLLNVKRSLGGLC